MKKSEIVHWFSSSSAVRSSNCVIGHGFRWLLFNLQHRRRCPRRRPAWLPQGKLKLYLSHLFINSNSLLTGLNLFPMFSRKHKNFFYLFWKTILKSPIFSKAILESLIPNRFSDSFSVLRKFWKLKIVFKNWNKRRLTEISGGVAKQKRSMNFYTRGQLHGLKRNLLNE